MKYYLYDGAKIAHIVDAENVENAMANWNDVHRQQPEIAPHSASRYIFLSYDDIKRMLAPDKVPNVMTHIYDVRRYTESVVRVEVEVDDKMTHSASEAIAVEKAKPLFAKADGETTYRVTLADRS